MSHLVIGLAADPSHPVDDLVAPQDLTVRILTPELASASMGQTNGIDILAIDGRLDNSPLLTALAPSDVNPTVPVVALSDPNAAIGVTLLMTGADFSIPPPLTVTTAQALVTAYRRRRTVLANQPSDPQGGFLEKPSPPRSTSSSSEAASAVRGSSLSPGRALDLDSQFAAPRNETNQSGPSAPANTSKTDVPTFSPVHGWTRPPFASVPTHRFRIATPPSPEDSTSFGPLCIHRRENELWIRNHRYPLTPTPMAVLREFFRRPGTTLTRDDLLQTVWGLSFDPTTNVVDAQVYAIRQLLKKHGLDDMIQTVRGRGYRLTRTRDDQKEDNQ